MSTALPDVEPSAATQPDHAPARPAGAAWLWAAVGCILLAGSGALRVSQDHRRQDERIFRQQCPIAVSALPKNLGDWQMVAGGEERLDELTMRLAGGTDHIIRAYANKLTGVNLSFLLLYGPAEPVTPHTPDVCYPASGFSSAEDAMDRKIDYKAGNTADGKPGEGQAQFRAAVYSKVAGRSTIREVVYHSFRLDGKWSQNVGSGRKLLRRNPGVFKLQVQRRLGDRESLGQGEPIEDFLANLISEIEAEINAAEKAAGQAKGV